MDEAKKKILKFIESSTVFAVMGQLKKLGFLTSDDIERAGEMSRDEWLRFMNEKIGIENRDGPQESKEK